MWSSSRKALAVGSEFRDHRTSAHMGWTFQGSPLKQKIGPSLPYIAFSGGIGKQTSRCVITDIEGT